MAAHLHTSDPIDNGGLFIRRPSTGITVPTRTPPGTGTTLVTRSFDQILALAILLLEVGLVVSVWIGQPIGWLWVASQVTYLAGSLPLGLLAGFSGMLATLWLTLVVLARLDHAWKLARRAAGCNQREGCLERLFVFATVVVVPAFLGWLIFIAGPGPLEFPIQLG